MITVIEALKTSGQILSKRQLLARWRKPVLKPSSCKKALSSHQESCDGPGAEELVHVLTASSSSAMEKGGKDLVGFLGNDWIKSASYGKLVALSK